MFPLKPLSREAVDAALAKAERYRLLNEPGDAESICRDVLEIDPDNQSARIALILTLTDQFERTPAMFREAVDLALSLQDTYDRAYYRGIVSERRAKAQLERGGHAGIGTFEWLIEAMQHFEQAELWTISLRNATTDTENKGDIICVSEDAASPLPLPGMEGTPSRRSLKIQDAPGLSKDYLPILNLTPNWERGTVEIEFDAMAQPGADWFTEMRTDRAGEYGIGPLVSWRNGQVAAGKLRSARGAELSHAARKPLDPIAFRHGAAETQEVPGRIRAHRSEIAEVYRQRLVAEVFGPDVGREVDSRDQHVGRDHGLQRRIDVEQRGIIPDSDHGRTGERRAARASRAPAEERPRQRRAVELSPAVAWPGRLARQQQRRRALSAVQRRTQAGLARRNHELCRLRDSAR